MSTIFKICNRGHNVLELVDILAKFSLTTSEKSSMAISNKNGLCRLPNKLPNDLTLSRINSILHAVLA